MISWKKTRYSAWNFKPPEIPQFHFPADIHRYKVKKHWGFGTFYPLHYPLHERYINRYGRMRRVTH